MKTDIQIAQEAKMLPITQIAKNLGIEDDELAAPVAETAQGLDLVGARRLEADEEGDFLLRELRAHVCGLHDFGGDVLILEPAADVVGERGVVSRLMRDYRDGEEE